MQLYVGSWKVITSEGEVLRFLPLPQMNHFFLEQRFFLEKLDCFHKSQMMINVSTRLTSINPENLKQTFKSLFTKLYVLDFRDLRFIERLTFYRLMT
jgi:hypothetical protein